MRMSSLVTSTIIAAMAWAIAVVPVSAQVEYAHLFPGDDAGEQIQACLKEVEKGGTCDARGLIGAQTIGTNGVQVWDDPFKDHIETLLLGNAQFTMLETLVISGVSGFRMIGTAGADTDVSRDDQGTTFIWDKNTSTEDVLKLNDVTNSEFENFRVIVPSGKKSRYVFYLVNEVVPGMQEATPQMNIFRNLAVTGSGSDNYSSAFYLDNTPDNTSTAKNNDMHAFYHVRVHEGYSHSAFRMDGFNQHANSFHDCFVSGGYDGATGGGLYGVWAGNGSFFNWYGYGGFIGYNKETDFFTYNTVTAAGPVSIIGANSEGSNRFVEAAWIGFPGTLFVMNSRFSVNQLDNDGRIIEYRREGGLLLLGNHIFGTPTSTTGPHFFCHPPLSSDFGCVAIGNTVSSDEDDIFKVGSVEPGVHWYLFGNQRTNSSTLYDVADELGTDELLVNGGADRDWQLVIDQGTGTDPGIAWDDSAARFEFDFDGTLGNGADPTVGSDILQASKLRADSRLTVGDGSGNDHVEFVAEAGDPACAAGDYLLWASSSDEKLKNCEDGNVRDFGKTRNVVLSGFGSVSSDDYVSAVRGYVMSRPGSVVGLSVVSNDGVVAVTGNITFHVYKNDSSVFSTVISIDALGRGSAYATQADGIDSVAAGDRIAVYADFDGSLNGTVALSWTAEIAFD